MRQVEDDVVVEDDVEVSGIQLSAPVAMSSPDPPHRATQLYGLYLLYAAECPKIFRHVAVCAIPGVPI